MAYSPAIKRPRRRNDRPLEQYAAAFCRAYGLVALLTFLFFFIPLWPLAVALVVPVLSGLWSMLSALLLTILPAMLIGLPVWLSVLGLAGRLGMGRRWAAHIAMPLAVLPGVCAAVMIAGWDGFYEPTQALATPPISDVARLLAVPVGLIVAWFQFYE